MDVVTASPPAKPGLASPAALPGRLLSAGTELLFGGDTPARERGAR